jgi:hypothetical protein
MSNLYTYFQRIGDKKMSTTADKPASQVTPKSEPKTTTNKSRTPMNMSDVYSADSPKPAKRKQADENDDEKPVSKTKSTLINTLTLTLTLSFLERKTLEIKNNSEEDDDEPQLKISKVSIRCISTLKRSPILSESKSQTHCHSR